MTTVIGDDNKKNYPDVAQSSVIAGIMIAAMLLFGPIMMLGSPITNLIPVPDGMQQALIEGFAMMVVAAPVLEEALLTGIILDGLLHEYSPTRSVLVSSILFGVVHLKPWQFVAGMVIGA